MSQQQQQMAMAGMGGPVGGGGGANVGTPSSGADGGGINSIKRLNTAIYDYLLRNSMYEVARGFIKQMEIDVDVKKSPTQRGQLNGVGDDGMDIDSVAEIKNRPEDLPAPLQLGDGPFLQDWWCQFWEIFQGHRGKATNGKLIQYIGAQRQAQKARTNMMAAGGMDQAGMQQMRFNNNGMMPGMNNGQVGAMNQNDLKRTAAINMNRANMTPQQQAQMQQANKMHGGNAMERQGSQMDMNGARSNSPGSGDAPSPKRQRLEGNMQQMNAGRPGPPGQMPSNQVGLFPPSTPSQFKNPVFHATPTQLAHTENMLRERGLDPAALPQENLHMLAQQPANQQFKSVDAYSQSIQQTMKAAMNKTNPQMPPNAAANMGAQGSPMAQGMESSPEFYAAAAANGRGGPGMPPQQMAMAGQPGGGGGGGAPGQAGQNNGNHALQDYQMQLMLLEQQNKKRLLMARQEQDNMTNPTMPGQGPGGFGPQGMSPNSQPRGPGDPSPNAGDMRGTPKMNKGMSSPNGDMVGRGSPQPGMMGGMVPPELRQQVMANGQMMRPPSSNPNMPPQQQGPGQPLTQEQMNIMRAGGHLVGANANGSWPPGQLPPGMMQGQPPNPNMTPRQQTMGPPPPPASGTGPSSPAQSSGPAPPTPNQANKPKPGGKKDGKKGGNKKGGANNGPGATPSTTAGGDSQNADAPPTPTPATPITPFANNSFAHAQNKALPNGQGPPPPQQQQGQPQQQPPPPPPPPPPPASSASEPFGNLSDNDGLGGGFNMDFGNLEGGDVLDNFDFDSFLNDQTGVGGGLEFDANFAFGDGGLEAGGDGGLGN